MAYNFLNTELLDKYHIDTTTNIGEWVNRNGINAMRIGPYPFYAYYHSTGTLDPNKYIGANMFKPKTSYIFDLWIDVDDVFWDEENKNVPGGLAFTYTDTSGENVILEGDRNNRKGYQHVRFISDPSKSVQGYTIYYYIGDPVFYRYDSYIIENTPNNFNKNGIIDCGQVIQNNNDTVDIIKCGGIYTSDIIEI